MSESNVFELEAQVRENLGKVHSRRLRRINDIMPAVIYGGGEDPVHLSFKHNEIIKATKTEAFYSHILTLKIAGKKQKAVVKAVQRHSFKPKFLHMDFQRISAKEKITMHVPLHFIGEDVAPGVKQSGGIISHVETGADISCLPADLPEFLQVDVSALELDQSVHLSAIKLPKGVELVDLAQDNDKAVASVHLPRVALVEEEEEIAAEGEGEGEETKAETEAKAEDDKKDQGKE